MANLRKVSFGGTAAIVASMALIVGLDATTVTKGAVISSLLIVGLADNLTDSLSVHIYQESERMVEREAFRTTVANFIARMCISLTFVVILALLPTSAALYVAVAWGFFLLSGLSYLLARERGTDAISEVCKHGAVAVIAIAISRAIGSLIFMVANFA